MRKMKRRIAREKDKEARIEKKKKVEKRNRHNC